MQANDSINSKKTELLCPDDRVDDKKETSLSSEDAMRRVTVDGDDKSECRTEGYKTDQQCQAAPVQQSSVKRILVGSIGKNRTQNEEQDRNSVTSPSSLGSHHDSYGISEKNHTRNNTMVEEENECCVNKATISLEQKLHTSLRINTLKRHGSEGDLSPLAGPPKRQRRLTTSDDPLSNL